MNNYRSDIALFRYALIRDAVEQSLTKSQRGLLVREIAATPHRDPTGKELLISRDTIDRWIRAYRSGGFEALHPAPLARMPSTPVELLELGVKLKKEEPERTAQQVATLIAAEKGTGPSARTLQRLFVRLGLNTAPGARRVFGRFEAECRNDRWIGDGLRGPVVAGANVLLFAFIDDHSRLVPGRRWFHANGEAIHPICHALRLGLESRGTPRSVYVDNGSAFSSKPFARACASLGIRLVHSRPGKPEGRGKIERFFRTVRDQFLVEVRHSDIESLDELNRRFDVWLETVYHQRVHSETGETPQDRFDAGGPVDVPSKESLHEAFLWAETRMVTKTATVSLHSNVYEVNAALVGRRVELVFDPFDLPDSEVRHDGRSFGKATQHVTRRHVHPQVTDQVVTNIVPTGIDYLRFLAGTKDAKFCSETGGATLDFRDLPQQQQSVDDNIIGLVVATDPDQIPGQLQIPEDPAEPESEVQ
jgi:putative transposase